MPPRKAATASRKKKQPASKPQLKVNKSQEPKEEIGTDELEEGAAIDWSGDKLSEKLLANICEDAQIKQGLFPAPGANKSTKNGGGKPKTEFHIFQIEAILAESPWFFEMYDLIGKRPNDVPTGIGNSNTKIDMSIMGLRGDCEDDQLSELDELRDDSDREEREASEISTKESLESEDEVEAIAGKVQLPSTSKKRTHNDSSSEDIKPKTPARSSTSKPTSQHKRKKNKLEEFSELAKAEELTRQKELDVAHARAQLATERHHAKMEILKAKLADRKEHREYKLQMEQLKLKQKQELRMMLFQRQMSANSASSDSHVMIPAISNAQPSSSQSSPLNSSPGLVYSDLYFETHHSFLDKLNAPFPDDQ
ncbi:hypothetical protein C0992_003181 [Termitomyces sp. T32_za158]|nr:hypothetical protein C0992_003181 [Termitomyces sp. T32_za158]